MTVESGETEEQDVWRLQHHADVVAARCVAVEGLLDFHAPVVELADEFACKCEKMRRRDRPAGEAREFAEHRAATETDTCLALRTVFGLLHIDNDGKVRRS